MRPTPWTRAVAGSTLALLLASCATTNLPPISAAGEGFQPLPDEQALWEQAVYSDDGQLLSGSMLDYAVPRASWFPNIELDETVTPSPVNPIGVKGVGEAGTIASTAAVANAVNDALAPLGVELLHSPITPRRIVEAVLAAGTPAVTAREAA